MKPIKTNALENSSSVYLYDLPKEERDIISANCTILQGRTYSHPKFGYFVERETYNQHFPNGSIQEFESAVDYVRAFFEQKDYRHSMFCAKCYKGSKGEIIIWFWQLQYKLYFTNYKGGILEYVKSLLSNLESLEKLQ